MQHLKQTNLINILIPSKYSSYVNTYYGTLEKLSPGCRVQVHL